MFGSAYNFPSHQQSSPAHHHPQASFHAYSPAASGHSGHLNGAAASMFTQGGAHTPFLATAMGAAPNCHFASPLPCFGAQAASSSAAHSAAAVSTSATASTASSAAAHRPKRPRDENEGDLVTLSADELLPATKRQHAESDEAANMSMSPLSRACEMDVLPGGLDDDAMEANSPLMTPSSPQLDGEIDTDQWNLSRLKLEVNDQFQPLLNQLSSEQAKRAAGFDKSSLLRDLQRDIEHQRQNGFVRAVWDKSSASQTSVHDASIRFFAPPVPQQSMILYQKKPSEAAMRFATLVHSSPIVTEVDDDEPPSPSPPVTPSYRSGSGRSSPQPPTAPSSDTAAVCCKRRRESDSDLMPPTGVLRIEEILDEDHDHKKQKVWATPETNVLAAHLSPDDAAMDEATTTSPNPPLVTVFCPSSTSFAAAHNPHAPRRPQHREEHKQTTTSSLPPRSTVHGVYLQPPVASHLSHGWCGFPSAAGGAAMNDTPSPQAHLPSGPVVWQTTAPSSSQHAVMCDPPAAATANPAWYSTSQPAVAMDYGHSAHGQPSYGYSSQQQARSSAGGIRSVPGGGNGLGMTGMHGGAGANGGVPSASAYGASSQGHPGSASPSTTRPDRSTQINDYVAKQKAAKLNAPLIKKENQRLAEARVMSASRSKASDHSDDYNHDDHSHLAHPDDRGRPISGMRPAQTADSQRRQSGTGMPTRATAIPSSAPRTVSYESDRESSGGGSGGSSNAELVKRVILLEDQIRLLKQQNRIFLSFMQNTEQQLTDLRAAPPATASAEPSRARSRANEQPPPSASSGGASYPNNMSQGTKQVLQRSQSERHTQPPPSATSSRQPPPAASNGSDGGFDQTFAPLEDDSDRRERMRSAKKKAGLLNLREKMAQKGSAPPAQQHQEDSRARGYQANSYQEYDDPQGGYQQQPSARQPPQQQSQPRGAAPAASHRAPPPAASRAPPQQPAYYEDDHGGYGGGGSDSFGGGAAGVPPGADEEVETFPCPNCERCFNSVALAKHVAKQLCKQKPRKVFNMAQKRLEDLASEAREAGIKLPVKPVPAAAAAAAAQKTGRGGEQQPLKKQAKWRVEHEKFMQAIQAGKQLQAAVAAGIPLSSLPPPVTREEDDDRTPCPHCGRKFQSNVADRHIPHCKNTKNKPKANVASAARLGGPARKR